MQFALRWILMHEAVTCAIPGAKRPSQAVENMAAADFGPLSDGVMGGVKGIYERYVRGLVHHYW